MPQKLFALLCALLISSLTLAIAEKPPTLSQISEPTLRTIDRAARKNFTPPISDYTDAFVTHTKLLNLPKPDGIDTTFKVDVPK